MLQDECVVPGMHAHEELSVHQEQFNKKVDLEPAISAVCEQFRPFSNNGSN